MQNKKIQFLQTDPVELSELIGKEIAAHIIRLESKIPHPEQLLTREQTCKLLDIDKSTLWAWSKAGKLKSHGISNRVYYKRSEIEAALKPLNQ